MAEMRVYLAGPDVFLPDAAAWFARKKQICAARGLVGVSPLDAEWTSAAPALTPSGSDHGPARRIARGNEALIRACVAVIANLTPFRGPSADPGTAFELGFARALGLKLFGYSTVGRPFLDRTLAWAGGTARQAAEDWRDADGMLIESFGLHDNLMLDCGITESGGVMLAEDRLPAERWSDLSVFARCVRAAAEALAAPRRECDTRA